MRTTRELTGLPNMGSLYAKAAWPMLPGSSLVTGDRADRLPDLELVVRDVAVRIEHLAAYNRVCGFRMRDELPVTYPHALALPLFMVLMTDSGFPFAPAGLVHIKNRITAHRPVRLTERLTLRVHAAGLGPHPKGQTFSLVTEVAVGEERVWEEETTMLRRGAGGDSVRTDAPAERSRLPGEQEQLPVAARWAVPADIGRRYAGVSGDRNPIHLYPLTSRLFGFRRPIAHGIWTKARCLAFLDGRLPDAFTVTTRFRAPVMLPAQVDFATETGDRTRRFKVQDAQTAKPHLLGSIEM